MKKRIIIGILTLIVVIGITSFSYGYLTERRESGNQDLVLSNFGLIIEEDMVSVTINDAYPMSDEEGTSQEETLEIKNLKSDGIIDEGIIDGNESISYKLVIWIDYDQFLQ